MKTGVGGITSLTTGTAGATLTTLGGHSIEKFQLEFWLEKSLEFWLEISLQFWLEIPYTKKKFKN